MGLAGTGGVAHDAGDGHVLLWTAEEVEASPRGIIMRRTAGLGEFSPLVSGRLYVRISIVNASIWSPAIDLLPQLSRTSTCVRFPSDAQPHLRPVDCAPSHRIYILPRSTTSIAKLLFTTFSLFGIPSLH